MYAGFDPIFSFRHPLGSSWNVSPIDKEGLLYYYSHELFLVYATKMHGRYFLLILCIRKLRFMDKINEKYSIFPKDTVLVKCEDKLRSR